MSKADDDAAKWMEMNSRVQYRNLIKAKELGDLYYINANGDVVIHDPKLPQTEVMVYDPKDAQKLIVDIAKQLEEKTTLNK
jgi:hypothetical protein